MKIIGIVNRGSYERSEYLVSITSEEINRILGTTYNTAIPSINRSSDDLRAGDEIPLIDIVSMTDKIVNASKMMIRAHETFKDTNATMLKFAELVVSQSEK